MSSNLLLQNNFLKIKKNVVFIIFRLLHFDFTVSFDMIFFVIRPRASCRNYFLLFGLSLLGPAVAFPIPTLNDLYATSIGVDVIIAIATPIAQTVATPVTTHFAVSFPPI